MLSSRIYKHVELNNVVDQLSRLQIKVIDIEVKLNFYFRHLEKQLVVIEQQVIITNLHNKEAKEVNTANEDFDFCFN